MRMLLERGNVIQIGHVWAHGGADFIAKKLGVFDDPDSPILVEGDVKNFDQGVLYKFMELYFSFGLVYDDVNAPYYEVRKQITTFLISSIIHRVTHLFGSVWGIQTGGVPSGCLNTSHMDSWVMALWFFLFAAYQIHNAADEHKEVLESSLMEIVRIIVYGDDHAYNKTHDKIVSSYLSGHAFSSFMKTFFDVNIQDIRDGVSLVSVISDGFLVTRGLTFLRHQIVKNTNTALGQPRFLPFRESREFIIRSAWGRESKVRGPLDIVLSCLGHVYGTYGSNYDAWLGLGCIYYACIRALGMIEKRVIGAVVDIMTLDDFKDMRRKGITADQIYNGFPTFDQLQSFNLVRNEIHDLSLNITENDDYY